MGKLILASLLVSTVTVSTISLHQFLQCDNDTIDVSLILFHSIAFTFSHPRSQIPKI